MTRPNTPPSSSFSVPTEKGSPRSRPDGEPRSVAPSTQDQVQRWLDIFVPMTGLPRSRANDIRAELEDHLRARVDDLMITGLSEPEAVQQAVNELGETADLAKQFRTALKPKRNRLMHAVLIAIAGSALTFGVLSSVNAPPPQQAAQQTAAAAVQSDAIPTNDYAFAAGGTVDLRTATLKTLFDQVRKNLDRPLVIHWDHLDDIGIQMDKPFGMDADPVPTPEAIRLAIVHTRTDFGGIAIVNGPEVVEITTDGFLDVRTKQIRPHDVTDLIRHYEIPERRQSFPSGKIELVRTRETAETAGTEILNAIAQLASRDDWDVFGGDLASANVVGNSLIIDAPARIHADVERVIEMMEAEVAKYQIQQSQAHDEMVEAKQRQLNQLVNEMDTLAAELLELDAKLAIANSRFEMLQVTIRGLGPIATRYATSSDGDKETVDALNVRRQELQSQMSQNQTEKSRLRRQMEDKQAYHKAVRDRLIGLKYQPVVFERAQAVERGRKYQEQREQAEAARRNRSN